eukprot:gnl/MRDRNA2_/MRDRNA2_101422_c0_seq1.p1 gnl/MRDRNA2_/MRDRNA2_101422_c0~~gnl/MRDRNA2_/MRDRNA2_101422_c0_seq1.p1  ORF type:complete len:238 (+),score=59.70 gnl/MRDRNA2_/MRDRNA2_101422_c0_seq1:77-715(+)
MAGLQSPKRPPSSYFLYAVDHRQSIKEKLEVGATTGAIASALGESWRSAPDDVKIKYSKKANKQKQKYEEDLQAFKDAGGVLPARKKRKTKDESKVKSKQDVDPDSQSSNDLFADIETSIQVLKKRFNEQASTEHNAAQETEAVPQFSLDSVGFQSYFESKVESLLKKNPEATAPEMFMQLKGKWKKLSPEVREKWEELAQSQSQEPSAASA